MNGPASSAAHVDSSAALRTTATPDGSFVVFLIGMQVRTWWRPDLWVPVVRAMGRMMRELRAHPELGLVGIMGTGLSNPIVMIQYWRSIEHLYSFSTSRDRSHMPAWVEYNERIRKTRAVGVWHETYAVDPGKHETLYVNMPPFGLAAAFGSVPAVGKRFTARGRLSAEGLSAEGLSGEEKGA